MWEPITLCCFHAASSAQAERQAVNTICQGSAADLVKLAMIQLHTQLHQHFPGGTCRLLLQVTFSPPFWLADCSSSWYFFSILSASTCRLLLRVANLGRHTAICMPDYGHKWSILMIQWLNAHDNDIDKCLRRAWLRHLKLTDDCSTWTWLLIMPAVSAIQEAGVILPCILAGSVLRLILASLLLYRCTMSCCLRSNPVYSSRPAHSSRAVWKMQFPCQCRFLLSSGWDQVGASYSLITYSCRTCDSVWHAAWYMLVELMFEQLLWPPQACGEGLGWLHIETCIIWHAHAR